MRQVAIALKGVKNRQVNVVKPSPGGRRCVNGSAQVVPPGTARCPSPNVTGGARWRL